MTGMSALASSKTTVSEKTRRVQRVLVWLGALLLGLTASVPAQQQQMEASPAAEGEPGTLPAVWKVREVSFSYSSSKSIYTCSALQARVKSIFLALGARDDLQVRVTSCNDMIMDPEFETTMERGNNSWDPAGRPWDRNGGMRNESGWEDPYDRFQNRSNRREQNAHIRARLLMPVEITREVMEEIKRDKSRRELISRVTGDPTAKQDNPVWFPAHWQPVTLSHESIGLEPEECELLDQMSARVFKELGLRVSGKSRKCSSFGSARSSPTLTVEALVMAPVGATGMPEIKLEGEAEKNGSEAASEKAGQ